MRLFDYIYYCIYRYVLKMPDRAAVDDARQQLAYCQIRSPLEGRAGSLQVHVGNILKANDANPIVVTPTSFVLKTRPLESLSLRNTSAMLLGLLVHSALKMMSYGNEHQPIHDVIDRVLTRELAPEFQTEREAIREEIGGILSAFMKSGVYAELCAATILAREVPFVMPLDSQVSTLPRGLMEGRIDLVYRKDGRLWVADYKSDRVTESEISRRAETYREQARHSGRDEVILSQGRASACPTLRITA